MEYYEISSFNRYNQRIKSYLNWRQISLTQLIQLLDYVKGINKVDCQRFGDNNKLETLLRKAVTIKITTMNFVMLYLWLFCRILGDFHTTTRNNFTLHFDLHFLTKRLLAKSRQGCSHRNRGDLFNGKKWNSTDRFLSPNTRLVTTKKIR